MPDRSTHQPEGTDRVDLKAALDRLVSDRNCFLCGADLSDDNTVEHVFPRWLQRRFGIEDERIVLLNLTDIPYRRALIPACRRCNNESLASVEGRVSEAVENGYGRVAGLNRTDVFLWASKILYGMLHLEARLLMERRRPDAGAIFPEPLLRSYSTLFALMQGFRKRLVFVNGETYSILTFPLKTVEEGQRLNFDYRDNLATLSLYMRLGAVGLIVVLEDCGLSEREIRQGMPYLQGRTLHPLQFMEIAGTIASWQAHLLTTPDILVFDGEDSIDVLGSFNPRTKPYDPVLKAKMVSAFTNMPLEDILMPDGSVWTFLRDDAGEFVDMPLTAEQNVTLLYRPSQR